MAWREHKTDAQIGAAYTLINGNKTNYYVTKLEKIELKRQIDGRKLNYLLG